METYRPTVVAVTGSVGKTSTKAAIVEVLSGRFRVGTSPGNFNTDVGVPLAIIGETQEPGRSPIAWMKLFAKADMLLLKRKADYPNILVLEFGADAPGDMKKLCGIARPDISVLTAISPVHLANYPSMQALVEEEGTNVLSTKATGLVVLSADDAQAMGFRDRSPAPVTTFGLDAGADVRAEGVTIQTRDDFSFSPAETFAKTAFTLVTRQSRLDAVLPNLVGASFVKSALAAAAVGLHLGLSLDEIVARFASVPQVPGRMRPIAGIKGSLILDDSYNAAPASMRAALEVLASFRPIGEARRIAALGHMAELGPVSEEEHHHLGRLVAEKGIDLLVTVGEMSLDTRRSAIEAGIDEAHAVHFATPEEAGRFLDRTVRQGDVVLVKGSQSARMEKVTKDLMAEPLLAETLLVRQYGKWLLE